MRRSNLEEGSRWLEQAVEDLKWAKDLARRGGYHIACFLAQQVAEKALKAFLYARGWEVVLGHSVERLCQSARRYAPQLGRLSKKWAVLDSYYIPTRYPNSVPDNIPARVFTADTSADAVCLAEEVTTFVSSRLFPKRKKERKEKN